jgi:predicted TIM-barrel fold metal-dependent hydrolase
MGALTNQILISGDSHMSEPFDLWEKNLPLKFRDRAPHQPMNEHFQRQHMRPGGWDARERLKDMAVDGMAAEVLYPTDASMCWRVGDDLDLEEACLHTYNEWMADYCSVAPERLWGLGMISLKNIGHAVDELEWCKKAGLRGAAIWIAAPHGLPYSSPHYEPFWAAAEGLEMPLAMHISARPERQEQDPPGMSQLHSVNGHKWDAQGSFGHLIASGVLERHPRLNFSVAEIGIGWIPFWLQEMDYYTTSRTTLAQRPSEYFTRQVTSTFISDAVGGYLLEDYADLRRCAVFSSDYPHHLTIWPDSRQIMEMDLGHLPSDVIADAAANNAARVFNGGKLPPAADKPTEDYEADIRVWVKTSGFNSGSREFKAPEAGRVGS